MQHYLNCNSLVIQDVFLFGWVRKIITRLYYRFLETIWGQYDHKKPFIDKLLRYLIWRLTVNNFSACYNCFLLSLPFSRKRFVDTSAHKPIYHNPWPADDIGQSKWTAIDSNPHHSFRSVINYVGYQKKKSTQLTSKINCYKFWSGYKMPRGKFQLKSSDCVPKT